jgi:hypothetical protein
VPQKKSSVNSARIIRDFGGTSKRLAEKQARRIQWRLLHQACTEFVLSASFVLWLRSIEETSGYLPEQVWKTIRKEYPGFLDDVLPYLEKHGDAQVWERVEEWISQNIFSDALHEGWIDAVVYYSVSDLRYLRALAYYRHCKIEWKGNRPHSFPSLRQWRRAAFNSSQLPRLRPRLLRILRSTGQINAERVSDAIERYVDWQEFASWAMTGLEGSPDIPASVQEQLRRRCPGFLECAVPLHRKDSRNERRSLAQLLDWITAHFFRDAKREGWLGAVDYCARRHPHWIRMMQYFSSWKHEWENGRTKTYPSFEEWRRAVDDYVEEGRG